MVDGQLGTIGIVHQNIIYTGILHLILHNYEGEFHLRPFADQICIIQITSVYNGSVCSTIAEKIYVVLLFTSVILPLQKITRK